LQLSIVRDFGMLPEMSEMSSAPIAMDAKIHAFQQLWAACMCGLET
jgi:hypothetical protein